MDIEKLPLRIRSKVRINDNGCWDWMAAKSPLGYGRVRWYGGTKFSHRLIYELLVGEPGPELDHLCRNRACCNPEHLQPVSHRENVRRGTAPDMTRQRWATDRLCPQGHPLSGENLYLHYSERLGRINRQCRICKRDGKRRRRAAGAKN